MFWYLPSLLITLLSFYIEKTQTSDSLVACLTNEAGSSKLCIIFSFAFKIVSYMFSSVTGCFSSLGLVLTWANSLSSASVTSLAAALILLLKSSSSVATWKRQCSSTLYYNDQDLKHKTDFLQPMINYEFMVYQHSQKMANLFSSKTFLKITRKADILESMLSKPMPKNY